MACCFALDETGIWTRRKSTHSSRSLTKNGLPAGASNPFPSKLSVGMPNGSACRKRLKCSLCASRDCDGETGLLKLNAKAAKQFVPDAWRQPRALSRLRTCRRSLPAVFSEAESHIRLLL